MDEKGYFITYTSNSRHYPTDPDTTRGCRLMSQSGNTNPRVGMFLTLIMIHQHRSASTDILPLMLHEPPVLSVLAVLADRVYEFVSSGFLIFKRLQKPFSRFAIVGCQLSDDLLSFCRLMRCGCGFDFFSVKKVKIVFDFTEN